MYPFPLPFFMRRPRESAVHERGARRPARLFPKKRRERVQLFAEISSKAVAFSARLL